MENIIEFKEVSIYQSGSPILSNINFEIEKGAFCYLIGKTGSGKSSLIKSLYGEVKIQQGEATVVGTNLKNLKNGDIPFFRRKLGIVFQDFQLLADQTVEENLAFVLKATEWDNLASIQNRVAEVLAEVGLVGKEKKFSPQLSGGEQQRLVIARAILNNPPLLIADEPTGNLDPETSEEIMQLLVRINREFETTVLMATHNYQLIDKFPARILKCENGEVNVEQGILTK